MGKYVYDVIKREGNEPLKMVRQVESIHRNTVRFYGGNTSGKSNIQEIDTWIDVKEICPEGEVLTLNQYQDIIIGYVDGNDHGDFACENEHEFMDDVISWRPLPFTPKEREQYFNEGL